MSGLIPHTITHNELAETLEMCAHLVRAHDSWEGNIQWALPSDANATAECEVTGVIRYGNLNGQGSVRMIGTVPEADESQDKPHPNTFAKAETPLEVLGQLAGATSVCWESTDALRAAGVFDAQRAVRLVDEALERLIELGFVRSESEA